MKRMPLPPWTAVTFAMLAALAPNLAWSQLDDASRDLLITKLSRVNKNLDVKDGSKVGVTLRLADLFADRARIHAMKEIEAGCTVCTAGTDDREKALTMYREVFERAPLENKPKILIQMGHLEELNQNEAAAEKAYRQVLTMEVEATVKADAHLSLAEMQFKNKEFAKARQSYEEVLKEPKAASRGLAAYRRAWSSFNLGEIERASRELIEVLESPALLTKTGAATTVVDTQFQEEVSRDLATFLSKKAVSIAEVQELHRLSPESVRLGNVVLLGMESLRVGRKKDSLEVWNFIYDKYEQPATRLETLVYRAPLRQEFGDREGALGDLAAASEIWVSLKGCGRADCGESQRLLKQFVVTWNQAEKKEPSEGLSKAYGYYLTMFPQDVEMTMWAAQVATERKEWPLASSRIEAAVAALKALPPTEESAAKIENTLLTGLETAESSADDALLARAQEFYLSESPTRSKGYEVRYQQARRLYDQGKPGEAAEAMKVLALDASGPGNLRKQAADLALDALVIAKNEDAILPWSLEFANAFPAQAGEFKQVAQKSILTRSAKLAESDSEQAWLALTAFDAGAATEADRLIYLKNKVVLAEKTGRFREALEATEELLKVKGLSAADREFALGRKAWFSELKLDFASAFQATEQMQLKDQPVEGKTLRLALYADLSGRDSLPFYQRFLKATKDADAQAAVAAEIVRRSKNPLAELQAQQRFLTGHPELLALLFAEAYEKAPGEAILKKANQTKELQGTAIGRSFQRIAFLKDFEALRLKLQTQALDSSTQAKLGRSIRARGKQLEQLDALAASAIRTGDWTSQVATIGLVAKESERFYQELLSLPLPEGLTPEEEQEYMALLGQQAAPFKQKADEARAKSQEFWANATWRQDLEKSLQAGQFPSLMTPEIAALAGAAPESEQAYFAGLKPQEKVARAPADQEVESAREALRLKPLDRVAIEALLEIEKRAGNFAMTQYLQGRLRAMAPKEAP